MPSYINPSTMMGAQLNPRSALNGALAGVQGAYATKMGDQQIRDTDLGFMENMHKYEQSLLDDPLNEAKRGAGIAESDYLKDFILSGKKGQNDDAILQGKLLGNESTGLKNENDRTTQRGDFLVQLAGVVDNFNPMEKDPATVAMWNQLVQEGAKKGVNLPSWPSEQTKAQIKQRAAVWVNDKAHQNKQSDIKLTSDMALRNQTDPRVMSSVEGHIAGQAPLLKNQKEIAEIGRDKAVTVSTNRADTNRSEAEMAQDMALNGQLEAAVSMLMATEVKSNPFLKAGGPAREAKEKQFREELKAFVASKKNSTPNSEPTKAASTPERKQINGVWYKLGEKDGKKGWVKE